MSKDKKRIRVWGVLGLLAVFMSLVWCVLCGRGGNTVFATDGDQNAKEEWKKRSSTRVISQTYMDDLGNQIVYYCCETVRASDADMEESTPGWSAVIDIEKVINLRECQVGEWSGFLCERNGRTYLCWTISSRYSCIIEYDADAAAEEDIFRMATSVVFVED